MKPAKGTWSQVSKAATFDRRISAEAFRVLAALTTFADERGACFPSTGTIAGRLGIGRRMVQMHLRKLEACGYVRTEKQMRTKGGGQASNAYWLQFPAPMDGGEGADPSDPTGEDANPASEPHSANDDGAKPDFAPDGDGAKSDFTPVPEEGSIEAGGAKPDFTPGAKPDFAGGAKPDFAPYNEPILTNPSELFLTGRPAGDPPDQPPNVFEQGKLYLIEHGRTVKDAGSLLGMWRKKHGDQAVSDAIAIAKSKSASDPVSYIAAILRGNHGQQPRYPEACQHRAGNALAAAAELAREAD